MDKIVISQLVDSDRSAVFDLLQNEQTMRFLGPRRPLTDAGLLVSNMQKLGLHSGLLKLTKLLGFVELRYLMLNSTLGISFDRSFGGKDWRL